MGCSLWDVVVAEHSGHVCLRGRALNRRGGGLSCPLYTWVLQDLLVDARRLPAGGATHLQPLLVDCDNKGIIDVSSDTQFTRCAMRIVNEIVEAGDLRR